MPLPLHSEQLLQEGLATIHKSAERFKHHTEYVNAERQAQSKRLRLWENYDPVAAAAAAEAAAATATTDAASARERRTGE